VSQPLTGIRVLDMATMLAGPYGATLLGDLGADVIKLESHIGDDSRHLGPERMGEHSPFLSLNRNKRSLCLDLGKPGADEIFAKLLETTDILITNIREPALSKLGVDYDSVRLHRADIIWVGVTAFGSDGPYAGRPGIDFLAQGYAGLLSLNGQPGMPPVRVTVPMVDTATSLTVCTGALAALRVREQTGQGQRIDVSLLDVLIHAMASGLGAYHLTGEVTPRTGNRSQYFSPSGVWMCRDGRGIVITCPSEKFFRNLCRALEVEWDKEARFATMEDRLANEDDLEVAISDCVARMDRDDVLARLIAADVLTAPINDIPDVIDDPQVRHNEMIVSVEHAKLGTFNVTAAPLHMHGTPASVRLAPPVLGQHTSDILAELGYADNDITALAGSGVVKVAR
jgi:crotonobetainyl-CoA:carnitine CoA-transferase CaiB-like acyl-CoA transferase